jgi:uncharacterized Rossmann fold enzyme
MNNITESGLLNQNTVYVVGSGPNGVTAYGEIPEGSTVIACNMTIMAPIPATIWICEDASIPVKDWFRESIKRKDIVKVFSDSIRKVADSDYGFNHCGTWEGGNPKYIKGITYGGGTVACRTVQLAAMSGAGRIILIGVDMKGIKYFDGSSNNGEFKSTKINTWTNTRKFDEIICWLSRYTRANIYTLTQTELKEPIMLKSRDI